YFKGNDGLTDGDPWISDGTLAGTRKLIDLNGNTNSNARQFVGTDDGLVYFRATISGTDQSFVTDGTEGNTKQIVVNCKNNNVLLANGNTAFAVLESDGTGSVPFNTGAELYALQKDTVYIVVDLTKDETSSVPSAGFHMISESKMSFMTTNTTFGKNIFVYDFAKFQTITSTHDFGDVDLNSVSDTLNISLKDSSIVDHIIVTPPAGYEITTDLTAGFSTDAATIYTMFDTLTGAYKMIDTNLYVRFNPNSTLGAKNGNLTITGVAMEDISIAFSGTGVTVPVTNINLSTSADGDSVVVGGNLMVVAEVLPENATDDSVLFSSGDDGIATVDATGKVVGVAAGTVAITVTAHDASGVSETIDVKVVEAPIGSIVLSTSAQGDSIAVGDTLNVTAVYTPASGSNDAVDFVSGDDAIATIDDNGKVTGNTAGTVYIVVTARDGSGVKDSILVKVYTIPVTSIALSAPAASGDSVEIGSTIQLTAEVLPANATDDSVVYSTGDASIATVSDAGLVTGVAAGNVTITATAYDGSTIAGTIDVKVFEGQVPVTSISLSAPAINGDSVEIGNTLQLTAEVLPGNATDDSVIYSTGDASIATVSATGLVTGVAAGTVTITATANDGSAVTGTIDIKVYEAVSLKDYSLASFTIIPNPSNGKIQVVLPESTIENVPYMIFSISGNKVTEGYVSNNGTLILDELSAGVYYMLIEDNRTVYREKLIVE
ncbi:MAG: Ig-like domain-containing protein, partial [Bacteroidales bacterium]|nr:Ig-like domain-containing protein [Bacteroidales bacterium]